MSQQFIDQIRYLDDKEIQYWTHGKNVAQNNIGLTCPFCGDHSYSGNNHLGINLKTKRVNCWICGGHSLLDLIRELEGGISYSQAENVLEQYQSISDFKGSNQEHSQFSSYYEGNTPNNSKNKPNQRNLLPRESTINFPKMYLDYLIKRNFDPDEIIAKYHIRASTNIGRYKFRIIIPVIINGIIVNFSARDITDKAAKKYLHLENEKAIVPMKSCLYNIDTVRKRALIFEGKTDVWRFGNGSIATMGTVFNHFQALMIAKRNLDAAFVMFDSEKKAQERAEKLSLTLKSSVPHVEIIALSKGDPADVPQEDAVLLKRDLGI